MLQQAKHKLAILESTNGTDAQQSYSAPEPCQSELFNTSINTALQQSVEDLQPDELSPKQALETLYQLKKLL